MRTSDVGPCTMQSSGPLLVQGGACCRLQMPLALPPAPSPLLPAPAPLRTELLPAEEELGHRVQRRGELAAGSHAPDSFAAQTRCAATAAEGCCPAAEVSQHCHTCLAEYRLQTMSSPRVEGRRKPSCHCSQGVLFSPAVMAIGHRLCRAVPTRRCAAASASLPDYDGLPDLAPSRYELPQCAGSAVLRISALPGTVALPAWR